MPLFGYDELEVKAGGGSVQYGSSAIGGSIHLNNNLEFNKGAHAFLYSEAASFGTFNNFLRTSFSNEKFSVKVSGNYVISQNDYEVPEKEYINRNGRFYNSSINIGASYKIAPHQTVSWQNQLFDGSQHYPILRKTAIKLNTTLRHCAALFHGILPEMIFPIV